MTLRITKAFTFEAAHLLPGYQGPCRHIHGHTYHVHVTVAGTPLHRRGHPLDGMVVDFRELKTLVQQHVIEVYDHAFVVPEHVQLQVLAGAETLWQKVVKLPVQPTAENILVDIVRRLQRHLPESLSLVNVKLYETPTSWVEWCAEDTA